MVVTTAMATIMVNRFWLSAPIESPIVATITSVEPRAFMPHASANDSRRVSPPISPPMKAPANLPRLAIAIRPSAMSSRVGSFSTVRSADSPAMPKNTGMKNARMRPRNCSSMCLVRIGDSPISTPATKAPSTVCTPMKCVVSAMTTHDHQDGRDHGEVAFEIVVGPADQEEDDAAADGEARDQEHGGAQDAPGHVRRSIVPDCARPKVMAMMTQPIESSQIAEATMICPRLRRVKPISRTTAATILIEEIDKRGAEEQRGEKALIGMRQQRLRHELAEREAAQERHRHAGERDAQRRFADLAHELEVGFHPGQQQQQQNAELRDAVEHGFLLGGSRKEGVLQIGPQRSQHRGTEQDAAEQHSHDRRLADAVHGLAEEAPDHHQRDELREEDDVRGAALGAFGGESAARRQRQRGDTAGRPAQQSRCRTLSSGGAPGHGIGLSRAIRRVPNQRSPSTYSAV